jgi:hypothetical protein
MNVYGFTSIEFNDEGGASVLIERNGITFAVPIISPDPGQKISVMSETGNPAGIVVEQADGEKVWVFILHGRLFATRNFNANPHELWLSWAYSRPHAVQRFTGLRKPVTKNGHRPVMIPFDHLDLPEEGKTASGNAKLDEAMRKMNMPIRAVPETLAIFRDRMFAVQKNGEWRRLRDEQEATAQKLILAAA